MQAREAGAPLGALRGRNPERPPPSRQLRTLLEKRGRRSAYVGRLQHNGIAAAILAYPQRVLAQRSALDLLDRIAVALNDYLGVRLPRNPSGTPPGSGAIAGRPWPPPHSQAPID
jgi:hypothetical protein